MKKVKILNLKLNLNVELEKLLKILEKSMK